MCHSIVPDFLTGLDRVRHRHAKSADLVTSPPSFCPLVLPIIQSPPGDESPNSWWTSLICYRREGRKTWPSPSLTSSRDSWGRGCICLPGPEESCKLSCPLFQRILDKIDDHQWKSPRPPAQICCPLIALFSRVSPHGWISHQLWQFHRTLWRESTRAPPLPKWGHLAPADKRPALALYHNWSCRPPEASNLSAELSRLSAWQLSKINFCLGLGWLNGQYHLTTWQLEAIEPDELKLSDFQQVLIIQVWQEWDKLHYTTVIPPHDSQILNNSSLDNFLCHFCYIFWFSPNMTASGLHTSLLNFETRRFKK